MSKVGHILGAKGLRGLSRAEKSVLNALADDHGRLGQYAELSMTDLVYRTRCCESVVKYALRTLERDAGVTTDRAANQGRGQVTRYHIDAAKFFVVTSAARGAHSDAKGVKFQPLKGSNSDPFIHLSLVLPKAFPNSDNSDRLIKARPVGRKQTPKPSLTEQVIRGLLDASGVDFDPYTAGDIWRACQGEWGEITPEAAAVELRRTLMHRPRWDGINPSAVVIHEMRERVRRLKLAHLDALAHPPAGCTCGRRGRCGYCHEQRRIQ